MPPKRQRTAASSSSRKKERWDDAPGFVHIVRWQRVTEVDEFDMANLNQIETCGHDPQEAVEYVQEEIDGIDGLATDTAGVGCGACKTVDHAITVRNMTLERLVEQAQAGVQAAIGCNKATYNRLKKKGGGWIVEYCDAKLHDGDDTTVNLKRLGVPFDPPLPGHEEDESKFWWRRSSEPLRNSMAHQVDYAVHWGGVEEKEPGCNMSEAIDATETVTTHVRVWIESMPLVPIE